MKITPLKNVKIKKQKWLMLGPWLSQKESCEFQAILGCRDPASEKQAKYRQKMN